MEIFSVFGILCILYIIGIIITFGCILTEMEIDDDGSSMLAVLALIMMCIAIVMSVFWPAYWYTSITENLKEKKGK